jgi:hypothetical protein
MFCFKGTVSQEFLLQVFFMNHLPPSLWKSANLWTYKICHICGPSAGGAICDLRICWPKFIADLQLSQIWDFFIFLLTNTYLKCSNANFFQIKNSAKQTCSWLLDSFAIKEGNFFLNMFNSLWKICRFAICGLAHQQNLGSCNLQINQKNLHVSEICGFVIAD